MQLPVANRFAAGEVEHVKRREAESIVVPSLPTPGEGESWYRDVAQAVLVA